MQGMYRGARVLYEGTPADRAKAAAVVTALVVAPEVYFYYLNKGLKREFLLFLVSPFSPQRSFKVG